MRNLTQSIIEKALGNYLVPGTQYPEPSKLTDELNNWYCFTSDGGHSILCLLECHLEEAFKETEDDVYKHLVPVPVKTVLRNYRVERGLVVVDLPYSFEMGLEIEDEDDNEYDYPSGSYNRSPVNEIVVLGPEVGEFYHPAVKRWPECAQFNVRCGIGELVLLYNSPQSFESAAVEKSGCEFGIMVSGDVIFFLYRFGDKGRLGIGWADQPFSIHLVPEDERLVPKVTNDEQRLPLFIYLVNASTGVLSAKRQVFLSPALTRRLLLAIEEQACKTFDPADYDRQIADTYLLYPRSTDMAEKCTIISKEKSINSFG